MDKKKGFWSSLFGRDEREEENLPAVLKDQYGIEITAADKSLDEINTLGFRRMEKTEIAQFNSVFQYVPQILTGKAYSQNVGKAFNAAVEGSFRMKLAPGMHLAASKDTLGAFRGTGLRNSTNQVAGQAEWLKNNATLSVSNAPQIALGVFNALSMVTGQYFMSQINGKMTALKESVDHIENFLDVAQRSKLKTACTELEDIISRSEFILGDPEQLRTTVDQLHAIQRTAQDSIYFCQEQVKIELINAKKEDKDDAITRKLNVIGKYMAQYHTSVLLYSVATMLEVQLREVDNPAEIKAYHKQIENRINGYKIDFTECNVKITHYLNENHVLNDRSFWQNVAAVASAGAGVFLGGIAGLFPGARLAKKVDELFVNQRKQLKAERLGMAEELIQPLSDDARLNAPLQVLEALEKLKSQPVEILRIGNEYFTNLPDKAVTI